jgi:hypothetical protein
MAYNNSAFLAAQRGFHEDKQIKASIGLLIVKYPDGEQLCQPPAVPEPCTQAEISAAGKALEFIRGLRDGLRGL